MNPLRLLIALPVLAAGVRAQSQPAPLPPDRPAVALARYKESWEPVVGFEAGSPVALDSTGKVPLPPNTGIMLSVGDRFADGFVTITGRRSVDVARSADPDMSEDPTASTTQGSEAFEAILTPDIDIPDAYAFLVAASPAPKPDRPPGLAVLARPIGDLHAGVPAHFSAVLPKLGEEGGAEWTVLVYSAGRQVRSTGMGDVLAPYFDRIETAALRKRIAERAAKGADAPIAVFRETPLGLPSAIESKYHGSTVKVRVEVNALGQVVSAVPEGPEDPDLSQAVARGFGPWLFLPPVKLGAAEAGTAIIPLKM